MQIGADRRRSEHENGQENDKTPIILLANGLTKYWVVVHFLVFKLFKAC